MTVDAPWTDAVAALFGDAQPTAERYVEILGTRGVEWGLMGPRETGRLWDRHVLNSLAVAAEVPEGASVVDVGSGAGLPGIPLAIARPDLQVTLLESLLRRVNFLQMAVEELGLSERVRVVRARAEAHDETYDVVTARAVAALPRLLEWCAPLIGPRGRLVALKGASAEAELADATRVLKRAKLSGRVRVVQVHPDVEPTWLTICSR